MRRPNRRPIDETEVVVENPPVTGRCTSFPIVVMLCLILGLHWTLLRTVGWVNMFVTFAQTDTVHEAWTKTFDGRHPCSVCRLVRHATQSEKKQPSLKVESKLNLMLTVTTCPLSPPSAYSLLPLCNDAGCERTESPPVPPPRPA